jgi:hypothetical protein
MEVSVVCRWILISLLMIIFPCLTMAKVLPKLTTITQIYNESAPPVTKSSKPEVYDVAIEVQQALQKRIDLIDNLIKDPVIIEAVKKGSCNFSQKEIDRLDKHWRQASSDDPFIKQYSNNPCAAKLKQFQKKHSEFIEIFVTCAKGVNVCQTNKTTDFYQADEEWWQKSFAEGKGRAFFNQFEFDKSTQHLSISVFVPVVDPENKAVIGVCKAVMAANVIGKEL